MAILLEYITREEYVAYAHLRQAGYVVLRRPVAPTTPVPADTSSLVPDKASDFAPAEPLPDLPLGADASACPGIAKHVSLEIFQPLASSGPRLFNVFVSRPGFRKTAPGPPNFALAVFGTDRAPGFLDLPTLASLTARAAPDILRVAAVDESSVTIYGLWDFEWPI